MPGMIGIGLVGLGTVGMGVARVLKENAQVIEERLGFPLRLVRVATRNPGRTRDLDLSNVVIDDDPQALIHDENVSIVVELVGGTEVAKEICLNAIDSGKHLVTANKTLLAEHGFEIFSSAEKSSIDVGFEAAVGGGIPILRGIREGLSANKITFLAGILNGTTNFMLSEMAFRGSSFDDVLVEAQRLGFAEADPTFDVDGGDAAQKLSLLASMVFGARVRPEDIMTEGIRNLVPLDFESARAFGYRIKLLALAKLHGEGAEERIEVRVQPTMISESSLLAKVDGSMNAVMVNGDAVGPTMFYGAGAGSLPTASAVVADLMEISREIRRGVTGRVSPLLYPCSRLVKKSIFPVSEMKAPFYLVFDAIDRPGVLGKIASVLGSVGISIKSVIQHGAEKDSVPVVVLTHVVRESAIRNALDEIRKFPEVRGSAKMIRIDEEV